MYNKTHELREKYLREEMYPSIFCVGCGVGGVLNWTLRALDDLNWDIGRTVFLSGIGCSSRLPGYIKADGLHATHGRAIAFATGVKVANPDLNVIVFTGDGDCAGIGGNHFIHAARRNLDITTICLNNFNYGMTGGQVSPTTPERSYTTTSPYGNPEYPFDLSKLAAGAGAPYVARWTMGYPHETTNAIKKGLTRKGFSFIELLVPCPTGYGRKNISRNPLEEWEAYKKMCILKGDYLRLSREQRKQEKRIIIGELVNEERPPYDDCLGFLPQPED